MNKAFFINGGAGRVLCSMPGLERFAETNKDFIIVSESWSELYLNNKILRDHVYPLGHKDLFEEKLKDKKIISPEPYRVNQYFNQKCNLIQAFDIEINELDEVPETGKINLELNKEDQVNGHNLISEVKGTLEKDKVVVFQPFGQSVKVEGQFIFDSSGRSFEVSNVLEIIKELNKDYGVILMSEIDIPGWSSLGVAKPSGMGLNGWAGVINAADYFIGCDSVGQHLANAVDKPATVVIGSTYPENISYPESKNFSIIDNGKDRRKYSPIRMTMDLNVDRNNEDLMVLDDKTIKSVIKTIKNKLGVKKTNKSFGLKDASDSLSKKPVPSLPISNLTPPVKKFGEPFTVSKPKKKKKPIDEILEIEAKKS